MDELDLILDYYVIYRKEDNQHLVNNYADFRKALRKLMQEDCDAPQATTTEEPKGGVLTL
ncbi:MAG: hypothetical protein HN683_04780 [Gammaproteobacteria bacterium]|jgi:hypothetical protein|nr:hypothetical protein [Gammaproteobacteria bacterium]